MMASAGPNNKNDMPSRSEAIRRLIEIAALAVKVKGNCPGADW
jgi:hypothetical protein